MVRGVCTGQFDGIQRRERKAGIESSRKGEFSVVAHDIICFVQGGSSGHSEESRKRVMFVFLD